MSFAPGDTVLVSNRPHTGHHRTPLYLKGRRGTVERVHGQFLDPETRAYGADGLPEQRLYLVSFDTPDGRAGLRILADVYEHWLEEAW